MRVRRQSVIYTRPTRIFVSKVFWPKITTSLSSNQVSSCMHVPPRASTCIRVPPRASTCNRAEPRAADPDFRFSGFSAKNHHAVNKQARASTCLRVPLRAATCRTCRSVHLRAFRSNQKQPTRIFVIMVSPSECPTSVARKREILVPGQRIFPPVQPVQRSGRIFPYE